jgi:hypothetical protein
MFAGAVMMHELLLQPLAAWIVPLVLLLGLLLLAGIVLELMKAKVRGNFTFFNLISAAYYILLSLMCSGSLAEAWPTWLWLNCGAAIGGGTRLLGLLPLVLLLGLLLLAGLVLELMKAKVGAGWQALFGSLVV